MVGKENGAGSFSDFLCQFLDNDNFSDEAGNYLEYLSKIFLKKTFLTVIEARERKSSVEKVEHVVETELILAQAW